MQDIVSELFAYTSVCEAEKTLCKIYKNTLKNSAYFYENYSVKILEKTCNIDIFIV